MEKKYHRKTLRHKTALPLVLTEDCCAQSTHHSLTDISTGGFSFQHCQSIDTGKSITILLPHDTENHPVNGRVVWCHGKENSYTIGVEFTDQDSAFRARMVKQICHIEHYRRKIALDEGRCLSSEEAAKEWITQYAADFPQYESN